jgi:hypothetical protein
MSLPPTDPAARPNRYLSFSGIDFDGQTRRVLERIDRHTLEGGRDNKFWHYFRGRRQASQGVRCDDLLLLASFVNQVRELFEACDDQEGLAMLDQIEEECF